MEHLHPDFKELLGLFNRYQAEYVIVGGYALAFYGVPRYTGDIDLLIHTTHENAQKILSALDEFGFDALELDEDDLIRPDQIVQLGYPPVRVDILTSISGVEWEEVWEGKAEGCFGDLHCQFIGKDAFVKNKKASGRYKDLGDIEALGEDPTKV